MRSRDNNIWNTWSYSISRSWFGVCVKSSSLRVLLVSRCPSSLLVLFLKAKIWTELILLNHLTYNYDTRITKMEFNCVCGMSLYRWYLTIDVVCTVDSSLNTRNLYLRKIGRSTLRDFKISKLFSESWKL